MQTKTSVPVFLKVNECLDANLVTLSAAAGGKTGADALSGRKFNMLAYTGAPVKRYGFTMVYDLAGITCAANMPALKNHDSDQIAGSMEGCSIDPSAGLRCSGRMHATQAAKDVCELADDNFKWQASMGVEALDYEYLDVGQVATVNGRQMQGPDCYIFRHSLVRECSFVPVGADGMTAVEIYSMFANKSPARGLGSDTAKENLMAEETKVPAGTQAQPKPATVQELKAAFPNRPDFCLEQLAAGATLDAAKLAFKDVELAELKASNAKLTGEVEKLKATPPPAGGEKPLGFQANGAAGAGNGSGGGGAPGKDFMTLAREHAKEHKCSMTVAMQTLAREQPDLHAAYVDSIPAVKRGRK